MLVEETCLFSLSFLYASKQTFFHSDYIVSSYMYSDKLGIFEKLIIENNPYTAECSKLVLVRLRFYLEPLEQFMKRKMTKEPKQLKNNSVCFGMG